MSQWRQSIQMVSVRGSNAWMACVRVFPFFTVIPFDSMALRRSSRNLLSRPRCHHKCTQVCNSGMYNANKSASETLSYRRNANSAHFSADGCGTGDVVHAATSRHSSNNTDLDRSMNILFNRRKQSSSIGTACSLRRSSKNWQARDSSAPCRNCRKHGDSRSTDVDTTRSRNVSNEALRSAIKSLEKLPINTFFGKTIDWVRVGWSLRSASYSVRKSV